MRIVARTRDWLRYEVPDRFIRRDARGHYKGQKQIWYLLQLIGHDWDLNLRATDHPEFDAWRWHDYWVPLDVVVEFKRGVYEMALTELARYLPRHDFRNRFLRSDVRGRDDDTHDAMPRRGWNCRPAPPSNPTAIRPRRMKQVCALTWRSRWPSTARIRPEQHRLADPDWKETMRRRRRRCDATLVAGSGRPALRRRPASVSMALTACARRGCCDRHHRATTIANGCADIGDRVAKSDVGFCSWSIARHGGRRWSTASIAPAPTIVRGPAFAASDARGPNASPRDLAPAGSKPASGTRLVPVDHLGFGHVAQQSLDLARWLAAQAGALRRWSSWPGRARSRRPAAITHRDHIAARKLAFHRRHADRQQALAFAPAPWPPRPSSTVTAPRSCR